MEFRLVYQGPLPPQTSRDGHLREKHQIRRYFHPQLKELWERHHLLLELAKPKKLGDEEQVLGRSYADEMADKFQDSGYRYLPLVNNL